MKRAAPAVTTTSADTSPPKDVKRLRIPAQRPDVVFVHDLGRVMAEHKRDTTSALLLVRAKKQNLRVMCGSVFAGHLKRYPCRIDDDTNDPTGEWEKRLTAWVRNNEDYYFPLDDDDSDNDDYDHDLHDSCCEVDCDWQNDTGSQFGGNERISEKPWFAIDAPTGCPLRGQYRLRIMQSNKIEFVSDDVVIAVHEGDECWCTPFGSERRLEVTHKGKELFSTTTAAIGLRNYDAYKDKAYGFDYSEPGTVSEALLLALFDYIKGGGDNVPVCDEEASDFVENVINSVISASPVKDTKYHTAFPDMERVVEFEL